MIVFTTDIHMMNSHRYGKLPEGILLDSGDWYGKKTVPDLSMYDALCIGNHDSPLKHDALSQIPNIIATNYVYKDNGEHPFKPFAIVEKNGLKILVVAIGMGSISSKRKIRKMTRAEAIASIQYIIDSVDADIRILLVHGAAAEAKKVIDKARGIDYALCGHSHKMVNEVYKGTRIAQAGKYFECYGTIGPDGTVELHKFQKGE